MASLLIAQTTATLRSEFYPKTEVYSTTEAPTALADPPQGSNCVLGALAAIFH